MWDAQEQYWKGFEWTKHLSGNTGQPTLNFSRSSNYPQSNTDPRYYNEAFTYGVVNKATHTSCKDLPNLNEMTWYAAAGEPRWDANELWTTMGHLHKSGMWFKKKSQISGYNSNTAYDGTDWRTTNNYYERTPSHTLPSAADANNYFYLPSLGKYTDTGLLNDVGFGGHYWTSSAGSRYSGTVYFLWLDGSHVSLYVGYRNIGLRVEPTFE